MTPTQKRMTYWSWRNMSYRCRYPYFPQYERYGGRGIKVCERWKKFKNFLADMGPRPSTVHSIDRKNNNGNYEPKNCRWATKFEQDRNRSVNRWATFSGRTLIVADWDAELGFKKGTVRRRLIRGWSIENALTTPVGPYNYRLAA